MVTLEEAKNAFKPRLKPIEWKGDSLLLLDQSLLPFQAKWVELREPQDVSSSIRNMQVRGAPAIGITAAYGMVLSVKGDSLGEALESMRRAKGILDAARPTAVNLSWATSRLMKRGERAVEQGEVTKVNELRELMEKEAQAIFDEEFEAELKMGIYGLEKIDSGDTVLTQCNAGGLATGTGLGTALAPVKLAHAMGIDVAVIAPETRPWLQGSRLTVYELMNDGVKTTLITDTAVGLVMYKGMVQSIMVGADRILMDGHVYNKIGTFKEAVIAHELGIPFFALAPTSTFDLRSKAEEVKIEERDPNEVRNVRGVPIAPADVPVFNPVFDVTPPKYVTGIITENGIVYPPFEKNVRKIVMR